MNNWIAALKTTGANISSEANKILSATEGAIIPLLHYRSFSLIGPDAKTFLQGQLSCDLNDVEQQGSSLGCHCNPKGQILSLFRIFNADQGFILRSSEELQTESIAALNKYIIFSKADIQPDNGLVGIGLIGKQANVLAQVAGLDLPQQINQSQSKQQCTLIKIDQQRYELWLPETEACTLLSDLLKQTELGSTKQWLLADIEAGMPDLHSQTQGKFIPQMLNLQELNAVSFSKGCYTGQEIITRTQHRGLLKRPMYRFSLSSESAPEIDDSIQNSLGSKVGNILVVAQKTIGKYEILATVAKNQLEKNPLFWQDNALQEQALPYSIDPALFAVKVAKL